LQISSAAMLLNIIKIGQHLAEWSQKWKGWTFWDTVYTGGIKKTTVKVVSESRIQGTV